MKRYTIDIIAKRFNQYNSQDLARIKGLHNKHINAALGYCPSEEVLPA